MRKTLKTKLQYSELVHVISMFTFGTVIFSFKACTYTHCMQSGLNVCQCLHVTFFHSDH